MKIFALGLLICTSTLCPTKAQDCERKGGVVWFGHEVCTCKIGRTVTASWACEGIK